MNNFGRAFAKAVDPQDLLGFPMEQDLQRSHVHADNLRPREVLELRAPHFIRHFHCRQLLLGFPDGADFRNGVDAGRNVFNQVGGGFAFNHRLSGNAALIVGG